MERRDFLRNFGIFAAAICVCPTKLFSHIKPKKLKIDMNFTELLDRQLSKIYQQTLREPKGYSKYYNQLLHL